MSDIDREIMRVLPDAATQSDYLSTPDIYRRLAGTVQNMPWPKTVHRHLARLEEEGLVETGQRGTASVWRRKAGASGLAAKAGAMINFDDTYVDDALHVQGTVMLSQRLRWRLRSFGPNVELLGPASLRAELAAEAAELANIYSN
ncbi:WYL domain-containing protein [Paraburkholderia sp. Tr-20389]|uniref:Lrp/AsnC family transcriptional regulator n=1 Tax=Paraburkholderia sp. Tr-20389 TaxID=2703903 RepID=UPI00197F9FED|nr:Lrp/AsnC family transcriptional regulator [Paraburkholderia sp. Tr-20389]MBN3757442.1 WYL domain-containing protein [Paraburkholderia sp. Tr-20389]